MKRILLTTLFILFAKISILKGEVQVIQVRRNIPLSDDEPIIKDYYLSGGHREGLKVNTVLPVQRWIDLREISQAQDQSFRILEPIGYIKVIYVQEQISVARIYNKTSTDMKIQSPNSNNEEISLALENPGIMIGDIVNITQSYNPEIEVIKEPKYEVLFQPTQEKVNNSNKFVSHKMKSHKITIPANSPTNNIEKVTSNSKLESKTTPPPNPDKLESSKDPNLKSDITPEPKPNLKSETPINEQKSVDKEPK